MAHTTMAPADLAAWVANVSTSVMIVFVNKLVMSSTNGYGFRFATTLTGLHFMACSLSIWVFQHLNLVKRTSLPRRDLVIFVAIADLSILTLNLSLMINTVSFYQIAKLMIIPFVCFVERFYLSRVFSRETLGAIVVVVTGVAIVTLEDLRLNVTFGGLVIAAISVVSSGLQQILVRSMQQKHKLSANELLANTAPLQAATLLLAGPIVDRAVSSAWVFDYRASPIAAAWILTSASLAVLVNISQFACLGRFSAVSFQVLGHSKTVLVLLGGWLFLGENLSGKRLLGMVLAVSGMAWYGAASSRAASAMPIRRVPTTGKLAGQSRQGDDKEDASELGQAAENGHADK